MQAQSRPHPLTVRLSQREKNMLSDAAKQIGSTRNALARHAISSTVRQLQADGLAR
jgi:predicted transcriptional regulator